MTNEAFRKQMGKGIDSTEKARQLGAMGGKASGESKRKKKNMQQLAQSMLNCKISPELINNIKEAFPDMSEEEATNSTLLLSKVFEKALSGDLKAFEILRDTSGQKPADKVEHVGDIPSVKVVERTKEELEESKKKFLEDLDV